MDFEIFHVGKCVYYSMMRVVFRVVTIVKQHFVASPLQDFRKYQFCFFFTFKLQSV